MIDATTDAKINRVERIDEVNEGATIVKTDNTSDATRDETQEREAQLIVKEDSAAGATARAEITEDMIAKTETTEETEDIHLEIGTNKNDEGKKDEGNDRTQNLHVKVQMILERKRRSRPPRRRKRSQLQQKSIPSQQQQTNHSNIQHPSY